MGISASITGVVTEIEDDFRTAETIEEEWVADLRSLVQKYASHITQATVTHSGGSLSLDDLRTATEPETPIDELTTTESISGGSTPVN